MFEVDICIFFVVLRKFGRLKFFRDVSHCFTCFLTFQDVGHFSLSYVVLFGWFILFQVFWVVWNVFQIVLVLFWKKKFVQCDSG